MNVALCFSGMPRDIDYTWPLFQENLIKHYNVDIFGSFWVDELNQDNCHGQFEKPYTHFDESHFIKLCKPKISKFVTLNNSILSKINEININKLKSAGINPLKNYRALCMLYMIEQSNRLRREYEYFNSKYDVVIRCRSDLMMYTKPNLENLLPRTVYMSKFITAPGINDTCWWSDAETANIFSEIFSFFNFFDFSNIKTREIEPEPIMGIFAMLNKIQFKWTDDIHNISRWVNGKDGKP